MLILSSISSGWELLSVIKTSIYENSQSNVFEYTTFLGEISTKWYLQNSGVSYTFVKNKCIQDCWILFTTITDNITMD